MYGTPVLQSEFEVTDVTHCMRGQAWRLIMLYELMYASEYLKCMRGCLGTISDFGDTNS